MKFKKMLKNDTGFSLVELIVVIAIMVILIAILVPNTVKYVKKAQETSAKSAANTIYTAANNYVATETADGSTFDGNGTIDVSVLWSDGVDLMNPLKSNEQAEIKLNDAGNAVEYVYYKSGAGIEADYPEGASGKVEE